VFSGFPGIFGVIISFPFDEVFDFSVHDLFVEYSFWFVFFLVDFDV